MKFENGNNKPYEETKTPLQLLTDVMYGNNYDGTREHAYEYLKNLLVYYEELKYNLCPSCETSYINSFKKMTFSALSSPTDEEMCKELEALNVLSGLAYLYTKGKDNVMSTAIKGDNKRVDVTSLTNILLDYIKPLSENEVCDLLSNYFKKKFSYNKKRRSFDIVADNGEYEVLRLHDDGEIIISQLYAPSIEVLRKVCRFYEAQN